MFVDVVYLKGGCCEGMVSRLIATCVGFDSLGCMMWCRNILWCLSIPLSELCEWVWAIYVVGFILGILLFVFVRQELLGVDGFPVFVC